MATDAQKRDTSCAELPDVTAGDGAAPDECTQLQLEKQRRRQQLKAGEEWIERLRVRSDDIRHKIKHRTAQIKRRKEHLGYPEVRAETKSTIEGELSRMIEEVETLQREAAALPARIARARDRCRIRARQSRAEIPHEGDFLRPNPRFLWGFDF